MIDEHVAPVVGRMQPVAAQHARIFDTCSQSSRVTLSNSSASLRMLSFASA